MKLGQEGTEPRVNCGVKWYKVFLESLPLNGELMRIVSVNQLAGPWVDGVDLVASQRLRVTVLTPQYTSGFRLEHAKFQPPLSEMFADSLRLDWPD